MSSVSSTSSSMEMVCSSPAKSLSSLRMARKETRRRPRQSRLKANASRANVRQEEHAVTLLSLSHRHARTVPEPLRHFRFLIVVVPARTQRRSELVLVFRQPLNHNGGDALIHAKIRPAPSRVLFRKLSHHLQTLLRRCFRRTKTTRDEIPSVVSPVPALVLLAPKRPRLLASRLVSSRPPLRPPRPSPPSATHTIIPLPLARAHTLPLILTRARRRHLSHSFHAVFITPLVARSSARSVARAVVRSIAAFETHRPTRERSRRVASSVSSVASSSPSSPSSSSPSFPSASRCEGVGAARARRGRARETRGEKKERLEGRACISRNNTGGEKKMTMSVEPAMVDVATRARRHSSRAQSRARNRAPDEPTESNPSLQRALCADGG